RRRSGGRVDGFTETAIANASNRPVRTRATAAHHPAIPRPGRRGEEEAGHAGFFGEPFFRTPLLGALFSGALFSGELFPGAPSFWAPAGAMSSGGGRSRAGAGTSSARLKASSSSASNRWGGVE